MSDVNIVVVGGRLTRDPDVRYTPGGTAVVDLGVACNRQWFDKNANEKKDDTVFLDITLFGRQAEIAGEYLRKGSSAIYRGRLQLDSWQDKETGKNRNQLKVVGEQMTMVGGKGQVAPRGEESQDYEPPPVVPDDDAPF